MKEGHDIAVDRHRAKALPGGVMAALDPVAQGRVQLLTVPAGDDAQAVAAVAALGRVQDARLSETARLLVEGLSVALGPAVLRQDVWEVYDILDWAQSASDGQRLLLTVVADERGKVLAATDPRRAPVGDDATMFGLGAVTPAGAVPPAGPPLRPEGQSRPASDRR
jgi:hypothetical protein